MSDQEEDIAGFNAYDLAFSATSGVTSASVFSEVAKEGPFHVIYADPPWPDAEKGTPGAHPMAPPYGTMSAAEILSLPVSSIADKACLLVMWTTWAHMELAMRTIKAWGFEYSTGCPWLKIGPTGKPVFGQGLWFRHCTEPLLLARRGAVSKMLAASGLMRPQRQGIFISQRQEHSRKPDEAMQWIETCMPGPRIELFARRRREGWSSWGNQVPEAEAAAVAADIDAPSAPATDEPST